jgi:hypothetical protein
MVIWCPGGNGDSRGLGPERKASAAFEFRHVKLGVVYHARVTADGFNEWDSP